MTSLPSKKKIIPKLVLLFLSAFLIRLVVIYPQFSGDVKNHIAWGQSIIANGTFGMYLRHFPGFNDANYPPVALLLFSFSIFLYRVTFFTLTYLNQTIRIFPSFLIPIFSTENMQAAFLKLPSVMADLGIGYLLYRLAPKNKLLLSSLYLFNPAVIYVSSVWGQIESLPIFFLLLSYFFLTQKTHRHYWLSHLAFTLSILSKQTALWLLPIYLVLWWKEGKPEKFLQGIILQLIFFIFLYLPFTLSLNPFSLYFATLAGSSNSITDQAFNLWYFIFGWAMKPDSLPLLGVPVRLWSIVLVSISCFYLTLRFFWKYRLELTANYLFVLSLVAFFLQTRVHDRHLAPAIPFLLLTNLKIRKKIPLYLMISTFHLINLYLALRLPFL